MMKIDAHEREHEEQGRESMKKRGGGVQQNLSTDRNKT